MIMKVLCYISLISLVQEIDTKAIQRLKTVGGDQPLPEIYVNDALVRGLRKLFRKKANGFTRTPNYEKDRTVADERPGDDEPTRRRKGKKCEDCATEPQFKKGHSDQSEYPPHQRTARKDDITDHGPREKRKSSTERPAAGQDLTLANLQESKTMQTRNKGEFSPRNGFEESDATHDDLESFGNLKSDLIPPRSKRGSQHPKDEDELGSDKAAWSTDELQTSNDDQASSLENSKSSSDENFVPGEMASSSHDESSITTDEYDAADDKSFVEGDDEIPEGEEEEGTSGGDYVENDDGEYVDNSDGEYVDNSDGEYVENNGGEYIDNSDREYVENNDGEYVDNSDGEYVDNSDGEYVENNDGEYVDNSDGEYVENNDGEYVDNSEGEYVDNSDGEYLETNDGGYFATSDGEYDLNPEDPVDEPAPVFDDSSDGGEPGLSDTENGMDEQAFGNNPSQQVSQWAADTEPETGSTSDELDDDTDAEYESLGYPGFNVDHEDDDDIEWDNGNALEEENGSGVSGEDEDTQSEYYAESYGGNVAEEDASGQTDDGRFRHSDVWHDGEDYESGETEDNMRGPASDDYTSDGYGDL